jgi:hypothetical protein
MEREQLIIEISAETRDALRSIGNVSGAFTKMADTGEASVNTLTGALQEFRRKRNDSFDVREITAFNKALRELEFSAKGIKDIGIRGDVGENARRARVAIYGLNQVVRDLPFGFIAISNNLPILFDQLGQLRKETGSTRAAISALFSGFAGAAGVSLAISGVLSLITAAVAKYGSLGVAIKEVTGTITSAEKAQNAFNKSLKETNASAQAQIVNLDVLREIQNNAAFSVETQLAATKLLGKEVDKLVTSKTNEYKAIQDLRGAYSKLDIEVKRGLKSLSLTGQESENIKSSMSEVRKAVDAVSISKGKNAKEVKNLSDANTKLNGELSKITATYGDAKVQVDNTAVATENLTRKINALSGLKVTTPDLVSGVAASAKKLATELTGLSLSSSLTYTETQRLSQAYRIFKTQLDAAGDGKGLSREKVDNLRAGTKLLTDEMNNFIGTTKLNKVVTEQAGTATQQLNTQVNALSENFKTNAEKAQDAADAQLEYAKKVIIAQSTIAGFQGAIGELQKELTLTKLGGRSFGDDLKAFGINLYKPVNDVIKLFKGEKINFKDFITGDDVFLNRVGIIQTAVDQSKDGIIKTLEDFEKEGGNAIDLLNNTLAKIGDGKADKKPAQRFDEYIKAEIRDLKASAALLSDISRDRIFLLRDAAEKERTLARNEAARTIQDKKALYKELIAIDKEYLGNLKGLKVPYAEIDALAIGIVERFKARLKQESEKDPITLEDLGLKEIKKINGEDLQKYFKQALPGFDPQSTQEAAAAFKLYSEQVKEAINGLSNVFDTLTSGVLEEFLTKGAAGFELLIQNVGRLAIKLAEAALKALAIKAALSALKLGSGVGVLDLFKNFLGFGQMGRSGFGFGGGIGNIGGAATPAFRSSAALLGQSSLSTKVSGSDLQIILNRSLREGG